MVCDVCCMFGIEYLIDCEIYIFVSLCLMCFGLLYYCSLKCVIYIMMCEDYVLFYWDDCKYFEFDMFYVEYVKLIEECWLLMV